VPPGFAALQIRDEMNALIGQFPEQRPAVAAPIKYQQDFLILGHAADILQDRWKNLRKMIIQGTIHEKQRTPGGVMDVDICLPRLSQTTPGIPPFGQRVHSAVGAEMPIDVICPFPYFPDLADLPGKSRQTVGFCLFLRGFHRDFPDPLRVGDFSPGVHIRCADAWIKGQIDNGILNNLLTKHPILEKLRRNTNSNHAQTPTV
jgi:hypothetical protein